MQSFAAVTAAYQVTVTSLQRAHAHSQYQHIPPIHMPSPAAASAVSSPPLEKSSKLVQNHCHKKTTVFSFLVLLFTHKTMFPNLPFSSKKNNNTELLQVKDTGTHFNVAILMSA